MEEDGAIEAARPEGPAQDGHAAEEWQAGIGKGEEARVGMVLEEGAMAGRAA